MPLPYEEIFKYTDIFNPISLQTLHAAGKVAQFSAEKTLLELGCGKGFPSLFWVGSFGVQVEGVDRSQAYVDYANARAALLNLSDRARFFCQDLKTFKPHKKYDVVSFLGVGTEVYGDKTRAFDFFSRILKPDGVILYSEPVWKAKPVPPEILKKLNCEDDTFLTANETETLLGNLKMRVLNHFVASKKDWELYVQAPLRALREIAKRPEVAAEAKIFLDVFQTEQEAAGTYWDSVLWVVKPK